MNRRRILVDVDGVMADFHAKLIDLINKKLGTSFKKDDLTEWDMFKSLGIPEHEYILEEAVDGGGFVEQIDVVPGTFEALQRIETDLGNVYAVTSPYHNKLWMGERAMWLQDRLDIPMTRQVHTKSKHTVAGCALVDDSPKNLEAWAAHWHDGLPILWDCPWNRDETRFVRATSWDHLYELLSAHLAQKDKAFA